MDREQYAIMFDVERRHWWYRAMRRNAIGLIRRYLAAGRTHHLLDAGCGTGGTTVELAQFGPVTGIDMSVDALSYAASRGLDRLVRGSIEELPFPDHTFDAYTCFDVQYHRGVSAEQRSMREAHRVLRPGGLAFFREPAFDWLRGSHDIGIHTARRFTLQSFKREIEEAGFRIELASYGNVLLFPLALIKRSIDRLLPAAPADLSVPPRPVNALLESLVKLEGPLLGQTLLPAGLSVVVVARA